MPLNKSNGNMYEGWVTHQHSSLAGECAHKCNYCYIQSMAKHYPAVKARYSGPLRLIEKEFDVKYGKGKTIFIEHCNDLFAADVPTEFIERILAHCREWPENTYVFQTKNPERYLEGWCFPPKRILGTTIETNHMIPQVSKAPPPIGRFWAMEKVVGRKFITMEPALSCDVDILVGWMVRIMPEFIAIGADSKKRGLNEPSRKDVEELICLLRGAGIEVRLKANLARLIGKDNALWVD